MFDAEHLVGFAGRRRKAAEGQAAWPRGVRYRALEGILKTDSRHQLALGICLQAVQIARVSSPGYDDWNQYGGEDQKPAHEISLYIPHSQTDPHSVRSHLCWSSMFGRARIGRIA